MAQGCVCVFGMGGGVLEASEVRGHASIGRCTREHQHQQVCRHAITGRDRRICSLRQQKKSLGEEKKKQSRRRRSSGAKWEERQRASVAEEDAEKDTDDSASQEEKTEKRFQSLSFYSSTNKSPRQQSTGVPSWSRRDGGREKGKEGGKNKQKRNKLQNKKTDTHIQAHLFAAGETY